MKYEQALRILREGGDTPFFHIPPVCTAYWDERDWVAYIWGEDVEGLPPRNSYHLGPYRRDPQWSESFKQRVIERKGLTHGKATDDVAEADPGRDE